MLHLRLEWIRTAFGSYDYHMGVYRFFFYIASLNLTFILYLVQLLID